LKEWKNALTLLGFCSSWRQAGLKQLYSTKFLSGAFIDGRVCSSNYTLIMDNRYSSLVKRMVDVVGNWESTTKKVVKIVNATEINCPGVDEFMKDKPKCAFKDCVYGNRLCLCTCYYLRRNYHMPNVECPNQSYHNNAASIQPKLAYMLKEKVPNITAFYIKQEWSPYRCVNIFVNILKLYESQIIELDYNVPELGIQLESPKLKSFGYDYNTNYDDNEMDFTISHPELTRVIKGSNWGNNKYNTDSCNAVEVLHLVYKTAYEFLWNSSLENIKALFPKIKFVILKDASYAFDGCSWHKLR
ncbi:hypothetical protein BX667DRAFT_519847, partial [Coemansia mojavensis]